MTPYIGLNFAFYETLKTITSEFHNRDNKVTGVIAKGALGGIAGGSAKFIMYPLDTVKKRLQAQTLQSSISDLFTRPRYKNMQHCFVTIWKEEGFRGFYRVQKLYFVLFFFPIPFLTASSLVGNSSHDGESRLSFCDYLYGL